MIIFYCSQSCTFIVIFVIFCAKALANRTLEQLTSPLMPVEQDNMARHGVFPPIANQYVDSTEKLRREYHLEDFLWAGSGDGPTQSDRDGGLAWDDNGAVGVGGGDTNVIRVTRTTVLYKTVLTTIFPIEMTPTVVLVSPTVSPTPGLINIPSLTTSPVLLPPPQQSQSQSADSLDSRSISPTQTFTFVEPTASMPMRPPNNNDIDDDDDGDDGDGDDRHIKDISEAASDRLYWVQTIIKANGSVISQQPTFQGTMQKHLAKIYASAFKRHLMSSLGVLDTSKTQNQQRLRRRRRRRRRKRSESGQNQEEKEEKKHEENEDSHNKNVQHLFSSNMFAPVSPTQSASAAGKAAGGGGGGGEDVKEEFDTDWFYLGQHFTPQRMRSLATTAMNVTVSILNISQVDKFPHVSLNYIVCAEGAPVPAASAVQDLGLVTKQEMEREIGYEVINKAEALVASPLQETKVEIATSPWLIVAIVSICVMVVLVLVIFYMVWTWKKNRLGDSIIASTRPQSGTLEGGIVNEAFGPPSPIERSEVHRTRLPSKIPKSSSSTYTSHKLVDESITQHQHHIGVQPANGGGGGGASSSTRRTQQIEHQQKALASELNILLSQRGGEDNNDGGQVSPSSIKSGTSNSSGSRSSGAAAGGGGGHHGPSKPIKSGGGSSKSRQSDRTHPSSSIKFKSSIKNRSRTPSPRKRLGGNGRSSSKKRERGDASSSLSSQEIRRRKKIPQSSTSGQEGAELKDGQSPGEYITPKSSGRGKKPVHPPQPSSSLEKFPGRLTVPSLDEHLQDRGEGRTTSMDKISYGNLDVCQETIARPISAKAKKLLPKGPGGSSLNADGTSISSGVLMDHSEWTDSQHHHHHQQLYQDNIVRARESRQKTTIDEMSDLETEEDDEDNDDEKENDDEMKSSHHEQDRDWSESLERIDSTEAEPPTKDVQVQTPTRRWKKSGKTSKDQSSSSRKKKRLDQLSSESLISTESEEVIEVHQLAGDSSGSTGSAGEINPLGKMRKRFHQFLDDAFNIMGKKDDGGEEDGGGRSKSAKVSISHHIETRETTRPWTSQVVREEDAETLHRLRPKSASFGPPKRAWTAGSERRRCHSAKSNTGSFKGGSSTGGGGGRSARNSTIFERGDENESEAEYDLTSTAVPPMSEPIKLTTGPPSSSAGAAANVHQRSSTEPIFPHYPIYADIPLIPQSTITATTGDNRPRDPAVPLILAIKEEIKRFEKVKVTDPRTSPPSTSWET